MARIVHIGKKKKPPSRTRGFGFKRDPRKSPPLYAPGESFSTGILTPRAKRPRRGQQLGTTYQRPRLGPVVDMPARHFLEHTDSGRKPDAPTVEETHQKQGQHGTQVDWVIFKDRRKGKERRKAPQGTGRK